MPIIQVNALTKQFRRRQRGEGFRGTLASLFNPVYDIVTAVDTVSFEIHQGEIVGYIGPNGAGKSTTIKMLSGILVPTAGSISVLGLDPAQRRKEHVRNIGVVFGQRTSLWWDVPVLDSLRLLRDIYKVPEDRYQHNLAQFTEVLGLKEFLEVPVRQLSLGQRVRADIAAALMHDPLILFLDEPTIGVDVISKERLRDFIKQVNIQRKVTVLLTTHDMNEIEKLSSRVMVIDRGQILIDGSLDAIRTRYAKERVLVVEFDNEIPDFTPAGAVLLRADGRKKWFTYDRFATSASALIAEISAHAPVRDLTVADQEIEAVIHTIYRDLAQQRLHNTNPAEEQG